MSWLRGFQSKLCRPSSIWPVSTNKLFLSQVTAPSLAGMFLNVPGNSLPVRQFQIQLIHGKQLSDCRAVINEALAGYSNHSLAINKKQETKTAVPPFTVVVIQFQLNYKLKQWQKQYSKKTNSKDFVNIFNESKWELQRVLKTVSLVDRITVFTGFHTEPSVFVKQEQKASTFSSILWNLYEILQLKISTHTFSVRPIKLSTYYLLQTWIW